MHNPFIDNFKMFMGNKLANNQEVLNELADVMNKNTQAIMRRQTEMIQKSASDMFQLVREVSSSNTPEAVVTKQADFAKDNVESMMSNVRELANMVVKSNMQMYDLISQGTSENMKESNVKKQKVA